jgi:3-hydroxybutyryl-CoA dehydrogenase
MKETVLRGISAVVCDDAVIATNTSSISVSRLSTVVKDASNFIGMHFFNPVPASKLVEVIVGNSTRDTVIDFTCAWVEAMNKTAIVVADHPGFASSRLGVALGLEAIRMVEEGLAQASDIDAAMTLGYGHAMGPLRVTDLVGLDVRLGIARYLHQELGERFAPPQLLIDKVERGELGRKSGQGFYKW